MVVYNKNIMALIGKSNKYYQSLYRDIIQLNRPSLLTKFENMYREVIELDYLDKNDIKMYIKYMNIRPNLVGDLKILLNTERCIKIECGKLDMQKLAGVENNNAESKIDKLKELKQLLDDGVVDEDEFNKLKDEIING